MQAQENQTIFDIALREFGSAEVAFEIAKINNIAVDTILQAGQELMRPYGDIAEQNKNRNIQAYYSNNGIRPATGSDNNFGRPITAIKQVMFLVTNNLRNKIISNI